MASTNKTSNYELSQYIGTDKPTYLNDYNNDMYKIDAGMYANNYAIDQTNAKLGELTNLTTESKSNLVGAINEIDSNTNTTDSKIGDLTNLETTRKDNLVVATNENTENIGSNASKIGTLSNLNTTNKTNLVNAINEVNSSVSLINLNTATLYDSASDFNVSNCTFSDSNLRVSKNDNGSLTKIYGYINVSGVENGTAPNIKLNVDTGLRPDTAITIECLGFSNMPDSVTNAYNQIQPVSITINTDGTINFGVLGNYTGGTSKCKIILHPCLIFVKDLGDIPSI